MLCSFGDQAHVDLRALKRQLLHEPLSGLRHSSGASTRAVREAPPTLNYAQVPPRRPARAGAEPAVRSVSFCVQLGPATRVCARAASHTEMAVRAAFRCCPYVVHTRLYRQRAVAALKQSKLWSGRRCRYTHASRPRQGAKLRDTAGVDDVPRRTSGQRRACDCRQCAFSSSTATADNARLLSRTSRLGLRGPSPFVPPLPAPFIAGTPSRWPRTGSETCACACSL